MESSYIPILESFPLLSVIAPYFGSSDKCFIVLSKLSVCIRNNLIKHYPEFRRFMLGYTKTLKNQDEGTLENDATLWSV